MKKLLTLLLALCAAFSVAQLPNPQLTPGRANPALTDAVLRAKGFTTAKYRAFDEQGHKINWTALRHQVFDRYGIAWTPENRKKFEVDHYESLEIGGSDDITNLWPEPWNLNVGGLDEGAHTKDKLENYLGKAVKQGKMTGAVARKWITDGWVKAYTVLIGPLPKFKN